MKKSTRREFIKKSAAGLVGTSVVSALGCSQVNDSKQKSSYQTTTQGHLKLNLGVASYTFRRFSLEETITMTKRLDLPNITLKSYHLPLESSIDEIRAITAKIKDAGLELYGGGTIYMNTEDSVLNAFDYAKEAGMKVIIGVPSHDLLALVHKKVQEYDIKIAIHNHGPGDEQYPTVQGIYKKIKDLDKRIGICHDIGHTKRLGLDPSFETELIADRLLDVHMKDVSSANEHGHNIEIGRGVIDIPKFLKTLLKINYKGVVSFEYEKDEDDPLPGLAESVGYIRGALSVI